MLTISCNGSFKPSVSDKVSLKYCRLGTNKCQNNTVYIASREIGPFWISHLYFRSEQFSDIWSTNRKHATTKDPKLFSSISQHSFYLQNTESSKAHSLVSGHLCALPLCGEKKTSCQMSTRI